MSAKQKKQRTKFKRAAKKCKKAAKAEEEDYRSCMRRELKTKLGVAAPKRPRKARAP